MLTVAPPHTKIAPPQPLVVFLVSLSWKLLPAIETSSAPNLCWLPQERQEESSQYHACHDQRDTDSGINP
jgi:hypothetical protein